MFMLSVGVLNLGHCSCGVILAGFAVWAPGCCMVYSWVSKDSRLGVHTKAPWFRLKVWKPFSSESSSSGLPETAGTAAFCGGLQNSQYTLVPYPSYRDAIVPLYLYTLLQINFEVERGP